MQPSIQANKADISGQVDKILAFPVFNNSQVLSGFLRFIVDETLEGREKSLKEYTIGTRVLAKKMDYDPQSDASVRIHAGRLRRALYEYYNGPGSNDSILISVPKGSYVPKIESISATIKQAADQTRIYFKPTLAVLPFHVHDDQSLRALGDGLCDQLCTELSHFSELAVVSYYSSRKVGNQIMDVGEAGAMLDAEYVLTGSLQSAGNMVRIRVQLIQTNSHHQIWASTYEKESSSMNTFTIQDDVVRHVVNQIAGSHGIIFRETIKSTSPKGVSDIKVYDAVFWYYHLVNNLNQEVFNKALKSVQEAVQLDPQYALGWAILGEMCVAGTFYRYPFEVERPLEQAVKYCREALRIDLRCDHAYQALALAYLFQHKPEDCLKTIEQWLKLNSNAASVAGGLGFCLICSGQYQRGYDLLHDSIQLNPYYPWWFNAGLSIYHFRKKEYGEAIYWAEKMQRQSIPWELILKAVAYVEMDSPVSAKVCMEELSEFFPDTPHEQRAYLSTFLHDNELVERLWDTLGKIGRIIANR